MIGEEWEEGERWKDGNVTHLLRTTQQPKPSTHSGQDNDVDDVGGKAR